MHNLFFISCSFVVTVMEIKGSEQALLCKFFLKTNYKVVFKPSDYYLCNY